MTNAYMEVFSQRLRQLREQRGISQRTLGELLGLSKNMISKYERGERVPSVTVLISIAEFFDKSVDYIMGRS